jgi:hypothetical protein
MSPSRPRRFQPGGSDLGNTADSGTIGATFVAFAIAGHEPPGASSDRLSSSGGANELVAKPIAATDRLDALQALAGARLAS